MDSVLCRPPACYSACCTQVDVRVCSLSYPLDIHKHFFDCVVIKTFPSVSPSGVRNSPTVRKVSLTPSQALSKPTSSYVSLPFPYPPLTYPYPPKSNLPCYPPPFPPGVRHHFILPFFRFGMGTLDQYKQVVRAIRCPRKRGYFAPSGD
jgi:hypothetical protein